MRSSRSKAGYYPVISYKNTQQSIPNHPVISLLIHTAPQRQGFCKLSTLLSSLDVLFTSNLMWIHSPRGFLNYLRRLTACMTDWPKYPLTITQPEKLAHNKGVELFLLRAWSTEAKETISITEKQNIGIWIRYCTVFWISSLCYRADSRLEAILVI